MRLVTDLVSADIQGALTIWEYPCSLVEPKIWVIIHKQFWGSVKSQVWDQMSEQLYSELYDSELY